MTDVQLRCREAVRAAPGVVRAVPPLLQGLAGLAGPDRRDPVPLTALRLTGRPGAWSLELRLVVSMTHVPLEVVTAVERALLEVLGDGAKVRVSVVEVVA